MAENKIMLVTGASTGIGASIAIVAAQNGYSVALTARNQDNLAKVKKECMAKGLKDEQVLVVAGDITNDEFRQEVVDKTAKHFGAIHVLINNAGLLVGNGINGPMEEYDKIMDLNLRAAVDMSKLCLKYLVETKGNIINISSICGLSTVALGFTYYCMTKAALNMFTQCLALELAPKGVRVNSVNPTFTKTPIFTLENTGVKDASSNEDFYNCLGSYHPMGRVAEVEEMSEVVMFLVSDKASFITGQAHYVDGGLMSTSRVKSGDVLNEYLKSDG